MLVVASLAVAGCAGARGRGIAQGWAGGIVTGETVIVGSRQGMVLALDKTEGTQLGDPVALVAELPSSGFGFGCASGGSRAVAVYASPIIGGDLVYVAGYDGKVYAFVFDGGELRGEPRWVYPRQTGIGAPIIGGLVLDNGTIYLGASDGNVYALDAADGFKVWEASIPDMIWSAPAVEGRTLYISSFDKKLHALNVADGSEKWAFETEGAITATPVVAEGRVYIGSFDRRFYAVDAATGQEVWRFPTDDEDEGAPKSWFWAEPIFHNGVVYVPNLDGKVYALDAATGARVAEFDLGGAISSSPVLVGSQIIVATQDGTIYALDTASSRQREISVLEETVRAPLFAGDGAVYVHTYLDNLYRIDTDTGASRKFTLTRESSD